ncbi:ERG27-3-keto sterol reductase [Fusarium acutatum]|uniref:3beta-hydroxysteroid 3-dehydrogenase n=1 Tax=Fusarium acutatum TaxID=78861 RepID=A0A8H4JDT5_9HYPO|nr:ERG27-3-keto sterol reductase [Fusarium acutatum]
MGSQLSPATAPWEGVSGQEQLFVLITGANSGIGLSIGERLIDEFLATRSLRSHLILIPTTRSKSKSLQTIQTLRDYAKKAVQSSTVLHSRVGSSYRWEDTVARIHVLSLQLDLLDTVVFNAAYGGWSGVNYPKAVWTILTQGLVQSVTWPNFKMALPTALLNEKRNYNYPKEPLLGEVFTARRSESETPGRLVWSSSLEAVDSVLDMSDFQCFNGKGPYESAKRVTDILSLTATLPAAMPSSSRFFTPDDPNEASGKPIRPRMYLTHPGIVASTLFPVPWFLMWAYELALLISRWIGSPWHNTDSYTGAKSPVWIALQEQSALDELGAERIKWGSSSNRHMQVEVKKTEVEGWGWEGKVEDAAALEADTAVGVFKKTIGRKRGAKDVTKEDIVRFEELGAECWERMENMRYEWETILGVKKA